MTLEGKKSDHRYAALSPSALSGEPVAKNPIPPASQIATDLSLPEQGEDTKLIRIHVSFRYQSEDLTSFAQLFRWNWNPGTSRIIFPPVPISPRNHSMKPTFRWHGWGSLSSLFSGRRPSSGTVFPRRIRLGVEGMEDRLLLAASSTAAIDLSSVSNLNGGATINTYLGTDSVTITSKSGATGINLHTSTFETIGRVATPTTTTQATSRVSSAVRRRGPAMARRAPSTV